jgi:hypothetical protein
MPETSGSALLAALINSNRDETLPSPLETECGDSFSPPGTLISPPSAHSGVFVRVRLSASERFLFCLSADGRLSVWDSWCAFRVIRSLKLTGDECVAPLDFALFEETNRRSCNLSEIRFLLQTKNSNGEFEVRCLFRLEILQ